MVCLPAAVSVFPSPVCVSADTTDVSQRNKHILFALLIKESIILTE